MASSYWSLEELGRQLHRRFNQKFEGRTIPSESVTEPFIARVVQSILEDFFDQGSIPFVPSFRVLNQSSLNDHFDGTVPDFSKHVNLIGLASDTPPSQPGIMNVAIDGEDARRYQKEAEQRSGVSTDREDPAPESVDSDSVPAPSDRPAPEPPEDLSPEDARQRLRLIRGGKASDS